MVDPLRIAYFPDSFHEVNGVAHTSRHFEAYARRHDLPFLCVRAGDRVPALMREGNLWTLELPRGILSFALERDLRFDPAFLRHIPLIGEVLEQFQPDIVHITGPSEVGMLGAGLAYHYDLPLAASWHTNVHEYLARRSDWLLKLLPEPHSTSAGQAIEDITMATTARFYSVARVLYAPNLDLCATLRQHTGRPCHLMPRGVDAELFNPSHRTRQADDSTIVLGFVGRLSVEKNVEQLVAIHDALLASGRTRFRFLIVGQGDEQATLRERMPQADFPGVLHGAELARAYANMDIFVFPSHTDTFGNVVLEALASGVPAIVTPSGGPRFIVRDTADQTATGRIATDADFVARIAALIDNPAQLATMRRAARAHALTASWDAVFDDVYAHYADALPTLLHLAHAS